MANTKSSTGKTILKDVSKGKGAPRGMRKSRYNRSGDDLLKSERSIDMRGLYARAKSISVTTNKFRMYGFAWPTDDVEYLAAGLSELRKETSKRVVRIDAKIAADTLAELLRLHAQKVELDRERVAAAHA
jgi:hypothetical protein